MKIKTLKIYTSLLAMIIMVVSAQAFQGNSDKRFLPKIRSYRVKQEKQRDGVAVKFYWRVENAERVALLRNGRAMRIELPLVMHGRLSINASSKTTYQLVAVKRRLITKSRIITVDGYSKSNGGKSGKGNNTKSDYTPITKDQDSVKTPSDASAPKPISFKSNYSSGKEIKTCSVSGQLTGLWKMEIQDRRDFDGFQTWIIDVVFFSKDTGKAIAKVSPDKNGRYVSPKLPVGKEYVIKPMWVAQSRGEMTFFCNREKNYRGVNFHITRGPVWD
ncbi:MAG: hypothetical protein R2747_15295 [Pyrinomonadaceae bacterium]